MLVGRVWPSRPTSERPLSDFDQVRLSISARRNPGGVTLGGASRRLAFPSSVAARKAEVGN